MPLQFFTDSWWRWVRLNIASDSFILDDPSTLLAMAASILNWQDFKVCPRVNLHIYLYCSPKTFRNSLYLLVIYMSDEVSMLSSMVTSRASSSDILGFILHRFYNAFLPSIFCSVENKLLYEGLTNTLARKMKLPTGRRSFSSMNFIISLLRLSCLRPKLSRNFPHVSKMEKCWDSLLKMLLLHSSNLT